MKLALLAALLLPCAALSQMRVGTGKRMITPDFEKHGPVYMAGFGQNRRATGIHDDLYARCIAFSTGARPLVDLRGRCHRRLLGRCPEDPLEGGRRCRRRRTARPRSSRHDGTVGSLAGADRHQRSLRFVSGGAHGGSGAGRDSVAASGAHPAGEGQDAGARHASSTTPGRRWRTTPKSWRCAPIRWTGSRSRTLINWANHPETLGSKNTLVTADYSGYLYREAERLLGGTAVFVNGAIGGMQSPLGLDSEGRGGQDYSREHVREGGVHRRARGETGGGGARERPRGGARFISVPREADRGPDDESGLPDGGESGDLRRAQAAERGWDHHHAGRVHPVRAWSAGRNWRSRSCRANCIPN